MIILIMSLNNCFTAHTTLQYPQDPNPSIPVQNFLVSSISFQAAHADISPAHGVLIPVRKIQNWAVGIPMTCTDVKI
jgi:hypothetical protein